MKKNLIYAVMIVGSILLSACGSNSKKDPVPPPTPPPGGYVFTNFTSELEIEEYKTYPIKFQLTKDGLALPNVPVSMKVPDQSIGSLKEYAVTTDENGKGSFVYTPPAVFPEKGKLYIVFTDGNITLEEPVELNFNLNTDIPSDGRATTLSITYLTSECDASRGIIGHYAIHAVDRFSRVPVVNIPVRVSLVNGVTLINNEKVQMGKGNIYYENPADVTSSAIKFSDESADFSQDGVKQGDNLIIFPSQGRTDASYIGGWDIESVSSNILTSSEQYTNLVQDNTLTYLIGNEERLLGGENGAAGTLATAHVEPNYTTDNNGYVYFDIVFDAILAGHTVTVEAHGNEDGYRVGVSMKTGLRLDGDSFTAPEETKVPNSGGLEKARIPITINPTCVGNQPLIDVPLAPGSFHVESGVHCKIDQDESDFHTDGSGTVTIAINTDGNTTDTGGVDECVITWDGDISSLLYEY